MMMIKEIEKNERKKGGEREGKEKLKKCIDLRIIKIQVLFDAMGMHKIEEGQVQNNEK